jgi:hypothetical protein
MEISLNMEVRCAGQPCGTSTAIVVDPTSEELTHLVVRERHAPHTERMVPIDLVSESTPEYIELSCADRELAEAEPFVTTEYVRVDVPHYVNAGMIYTMPYVIRDSKTASVPEQEEHIPPHELAVRRGARVEATDGPIGRVDEFLVDPANHHITHLILREGHLWAQRDVAIPVSAIERCDERQVELKLSKEEVGQLPQIPVHRGILEHEVLDEMTGDESSTQSE